MSNDLDLVLICTESGNHYNHSIDTLKAGKHVVVEKPPALFPKQVIELEKIQKKKI